MLKAKTLRRHLGGHHHHHDQSLPHGRGGAPPEYAPPLVELKRGGLTESLHRGAIVAAGPDGKRARGLGHPAMPTFLRSAAKPLQALPVITTGAAQRYGLSPDDEITDGNREAVVNKLNRKLAAPAPAPPAATAKGAKPKAAEPAPVVAPVGETADEAFENLLKQKAFVEGTIKACLPAGQKAY